MKQTFLKSIGSDKKGLFPRLILEDDGTVKIRTQIFKDGKPTGKFSDLEVTTTGPTVIS